MAGGNLSPRQKMINMMYLVLTALLAMNVSAEILEAFSSLRRSLESSVENFAEKNRDTKAMIIAKVDEEVEQGNKKNQYIKGLAQNVEQESNRVLGVLNGMVEKLEEIGEKDPETGEIQNKKENERNYQFWMGAGKDQSNNGRGAGAAMKMKDELNGFVKWAENFVNENDTTGRVWKSMDIKPICVDPADDPKIPADNENKKKTWEYFTFHSKPLIADLAMLEKFKMDVEEVEFQLLNFLKGKLGAVTFKIDSLIAVDAPVSQVVAAGMKFETKLYVAMSSSEIKPEFSGSGSIDVDESGNSAIMTLQARGGFAKEQNEKKQSYNAIIKVPRTDGGMEELKVEGEFTVRKPEVVITSASVQNLYWKCGNALKVDVPALGELYSPVFKASSAEVIKSPADKKIVTIVPSGRVCDLSVASNTNGQIIDIDKIRYNVIKPPRPTIELIVSGKPHDGVTPISKKTSVIIRVDPDEDFKKALPKDARYMFSKIDLLSQRSLGAPTKVATETGNGKDATRGLKFSLGGALRSDRAGTKIYFQIDDIYRVNFKGQKVKEKFSERDRTISATIR